MNISCFLLTQSAFDKTLRVARNNASYLILTRSPSSLLAIRTLGAQLFPGNGRFFQEAYRQATEDQFGYLVVDNHPQGHPLLRLKTHILPGETPVVFIGGNAL
jgi:hypothetical protein